MAKFLSDEVLDGGLDVVATCVQLLICSQAPTNYTEATSTYKLAGITVDGSDFSKADDVSGRKITVAQQASVIGTATGTGTHVALVDADTLHVVSDLSSSTSITSGLPKTVQEWKINIEDPT